MNTDAVQVRAELVHGGPRVIARPTRFVMLRGDSLKAIGVLVVQLPPARARLLIQGRLGTINMNATIKHPRIALQTRCAMLQAASLKATGTLGAKLHAIVTKPVCCTTLQSATNVVMSFAKVIRRTNQMWRHSTP